jgi:hypothetical protein
LSRAVTEVTGGIGSTGKSLTAIDCPSNLPFPTFGPKEAAVFEAPATAVAAVELLAARTMPKLV